MTDGAVVQVSDQEAIRAVLAEIEERDGQVTAQAVVAWAKRHKGHPLAKYFEWNQKKAAEKHWLETARRVIRIVQYESRTVDRGVVRVPLYSRDPNGGRNPGYLRTDNIRGAGDLQRDLLRQEFNRAAGCLRRAHAIASGLGWDQDAIDQILADLDDLADGVPVAESARKAV